MKMKLMDEELKKIIRPYLIDHGEKEYETILNLKIFMGRVFFWGFVIGMIISGVIFGL